MTLGIPCKLTVFDNEAHFPMTLSNDAVSTDAGNALGTAPGTAGMELGTLNSFGSYYASDLCLERE